MCFQRSLGRTFLKKVSPQAFLQKLLYMLWLADFLFREIGKPEINMNFLKGGRGKLLCKEVSPEFHFLENAFVLASNMAWMHERRQECLLLTRLWPRELPAEHLDHRIANPVA